MAEARGSSPLSSTSKDADGFLPRTVGAHEFRNHFGYHLDRAAAGEELLVTRRGRPYARLSPAAPERLALGLL
ncbi:MAG: type II toxin-antitoxin system prevent-host-death family antitoxin [Thermoleophilaceae bacterium]|nr:type II toxin-antitoxin system prevent-host-death family antitoxin [Thermoleophilaceae bacterium]